ncbi:Uncharacterised protein [Starkeya nomas]|uniref:Transmembrane signal peptide protein n=2 Tax=Xanthobacteraceae TaxID=335928 RepID=A0A5S9P334_9HYPH|nr:MULTISPECIES: RcnB family protein [Xanthobacteraceae]TSJ62622.1 transmembrane signal peptide protein [Ancylobacter moscoviensis]CAA0097757.1 Uncharacterised protein [Starkeya nomas]
MYKSVIAGLAMLMIPGSTAVFAQGYYNPQGKPPAGYHQNYKPHHGYQAPRKRSHWSRGERLPSQYRRDVVRDYKRYRLAPPPRGHHWVRVNNDYLLISATTGLIASVFGAR